MITVLSVAFLLLSRTESFPAVDSAGTNRVVALVKQLGASSFEKRKEAETALKALDRSFLPVLKAYLADDDPEIKVSMREIVEFVSSKIGFSDARLEAAVRAAISRPGTSVIYKADIQGISKLEADYAGISDVDGIQNLVKLREISLANNTISNLTPFAGMTGLTRLNLENNRITNISALVAAAGFKSRQGYASIVLSGNPLDVQSQEEIIPQLKAMGKHVVFVQEKPLPDYAFLHLEKDPLRPYDTMMLLIDAKPREEYEQLYRLFGTVRVNGASRMDGKPLAMEEYKSLVVNGYNNTGIDFFNTVGVGPMAPAEEGDHEFILVLEAGESRWKCKPLTIHVRAPAGSGEMLKDFEKTGASAFLKHKRGARLPAEEKLPALPYDAVENFLKKYPDSFLKAQLGEQIYRLIRGEVYYENLEILAEDRASIARLMPLAFPSYKNSIRVLRDGVNKQSSHPEERKKRINDMLDLWLKDSEPAPAK